MGGWFPGGSMFIFAEETKLKELANKIAKKLA